jgi:hypothetical protein
MGEAIRIGTVPEYRIAAEKEGFLSDRIEDLSARTEHFWSTTIALIEAEGRDSGAGFGGAEKREKSLQAHRLMRKGLGEGGLRYALLGFSKRAP